jgi:hypothetical protein
MYKLVYHPGAGLTQSKTFATICDALKFSLKLKMFEFYDLYKITE